MTDDKSTSDKVSEDKGESLKDKYHRVQAEARKARLIVGGLLLVAASLNAGYILLSSKSFIENRLPEVGSELAVRIQPITVKHIPEVRHSIKRLAPVYMRAFEGMIEREMPGTEKRLKATLTRLEARAKKQWPNIQHQVDELVKKREADFKRNLTKVVGKEVSDEEIHDLLRTYSTVTNRRLEEFWHKSYSDHKSVVDELRGTVIRLNRTEPDLNREVNLIEAAGLLLEFAGVQLQANS